MRRFTVGMAVCALGLATLTPSQALPPDVQSGHWAAWAVREVLDNHVMSLEADHRFHGEAKVTRAQAAIALAKLAQTLEANRWHPSKSVAVPDSITTTLQKGNWQRHPVTRYMLATLLARFGDYVINGITRAPAGSKDVNQSEIVPAKTVVKVARTYPAYEALAYLADRHEVWPGSPLLTPSDKPMTGDEMSQAITEMIVGLNNRLTSMGHDAEGNTPDATFHTQKSQSKQP